MMKWRYLSALKGKVIGRGQLIRFPSPDPEEGIIDMMLVYDFEMYWVVTSGMHAGKMYQNGYGLSWSDVPNCVQADWLIKNWDRYFFKGVDINQIYVCDNYPPPRRMPKKKGSRVNEDMKWQRLLDIQAEHLELGAVFRFESEYPYEDIVDLMFVENCEKDGYYLAVCSGYKAGHVNTRFFAQDYGDHAINDKKQIRVQWLIENWRKRIMPEVKLKKLFVLPYYPAADRLPNHLEKIRSHFDDA
jgi:hypothetical protein